MPPLRINCIPVVDLTDQHLRNEYTDILQISKTLKRAINNQASSIKFAVEC